MLSLQEVGRRRQILKGDPGKLYVFVGEEYGVKRRYLDIIKKAYDGRYVTMDTMEEVLSVMGRKHLIPLEKQLYIVRYDETFIQELSDKTQSRIDNLNIVGTIVAIYESDKHAKKVAKYLPNYTIRFDIVSPQFVKKYLKEDFPELDDRFIDIAITSTTNYSQANHMCNSMSYGQKELGKLPDDEIADTLGTFRVSSDSQIRMGVASRNAAYVLNAIDSYDGANDNILYTMLSTMLELEKVILNPRADSDIKEYAKRWNLKDVYYYFNHVYSQLKMLRSMSSDIKLSLYYLTSLLAFKEIPNEEAI